MTTPQDPNQPPLPHKSRGAVSNMAGRYELITTTTIDDGWHRQEEEEFKKNEFVTEVTEEHAKTILTRNKSPDILFNISLNPYRGCEHGCIYCYARPNHSFLNLSPGLDFETKLFAKVNTPELLRPELATPSYQPEPIALGINVDMHQPCEGKFKLSREILQVLWDCRHPAYLITKSSLIERDMDLQMDLFQ